MQHYRGSQAGVPGALVPGGIKRIGERGNHLPSCFYVFRHSFCNRSADVGTDLGYQLLSASVEISFENGKATIHSLELDPLAHNLGSNGRPLPV